MASPPHHPLGFPALVVLLCLLVVVLVAAALFVGLRSREPQLPLPEPAVAAAEEEEEEDPAEEGGSGREKRRRRKARRRQRKGEEVGGGDDAGDGEADGALLLRRRPRFPLASVTGALQRRITAQYDDLVQASQAQSLTIDKLLAFAIEGFAFSLPLEPIVMEVPLVRILLAIIANMYLQPPYQQPYSSPPESSQSSTPPASESGAKRRRRRRKQKGMDDGEVVSVHKKKEATKSAFPLLLLCGATKRRITELYNELLQIVHAKKYDIDKVNEFINCLVDARNELLHKCETVQRSCKIKKALLSNPCSRRANSYDRLCEQVNKLEAEHKRLKKDADIYNYIQEHLKMSPSYKMLVELSAVMEKEAREHALSAEGAEITFEELLAQEKSDSAFWQRHKKLSSIPSK